MVRLGVRLIQAKGLGRGNNTSQVDPFATIKCEKTKRMSKAVAQVRSLRRFHTCPDHDQHKNCLIQIPLTLLSPSLVPK